MYRTIELTKQSGGGGKNGGDKGRIMHPTSFWAAKLQSATGADNSSYADKLHMTH